MAYQTKQQQAVLQCLQHRSEECLSAADLSEELRRSGLDRGAGHGVPPAGQADPAGTGA